jgi:CheY-like chemotaxis protein
MSQGVIELREEIWVAEDQDEVRIFFMRAIQRGGFSMPIHFFPSGLELVKFARSSSFSPKLILLDLDMPGLGGLDALRQVRMFNSTAGAPIAIFSSSVADSDVQEAQKRGADLYIVKPRNLEEFDLIARFLAGFPTRVSALQKLTLPIYPSELEYLYCAQAQSLMVQ